MTRFIRVIVLIAFLIITSCDHNEVKNFGARIKYEINLTDRSHDTFKVSVSVSQLSLSDRIFEFASTAPGIYGITDIGRFIQNFKAYDQSGNEINVNRIGTNQWSIADPLSTALIEYEARDTWDATVAGNGIGKMCGSSLEEDHALLNPYCVIGFFPRLKDEGMTVRLDIPDHWTIGTTLKKNADSDYEADSFQTLADSPFLMGNLSQASLSLSGVNVSIYCYSKDDQVNALVLSGVIAKVLDAENDFLKKIPVDDYSFLFHFGEFSSGAWEHANSSEYVLRGYRDDSLQPIIAHEFFHVVTPCRVHSQIIEDFNFEKPTPSQHLWLYEGVTEWAANTLLFRAGESTEETYLEALETMINVDLQHYDPDYSLLDMALKCYEPQGQWQYNNIYYRGAIVATLLDIKLLELSNGKHGLREVMLELMKTYGEHKPFDEEGFFQSFVDMTYPEISDFIDRFIRHHQPLPYQEYFNKVGIQCLNGSGYFDLSIIPNTNASQQALHKAWIGNL